MNNVLQKGRKGIRPGHIPTIVEYEVPASPIKRAHHVRRRQWITPEKAVKTKASIDWDLIEKTGIRIPTPDMINPEVSPKVANEYFKMFYQGEEPSFERRLHRHIGSGKLHPVSKWHKGEKIRAYHKDELLKFRNEYYGSYEDPSWLDQYHIQTQIIPIRIGNYKTQAIKYYRLKGPEILTYEINGIPYVYSEKHQPRPIKFIGKRPNVDALNVIQRIFERELVRKAINDMIHLEVFKENIIRKADVLLNSSLQENHMIYSHFESGEDEVNLTGMNDEYTVQVNKIPVISTDNLQSAISKYYSEVGKIMNSQNEDKDLALELLGEKLISMNREIRPMIEKLGNGDETSKWLKNLDFSDLSFEFDDNGILKFLFLPSLQSAEPWKGAQVQMVPLIEEMGAGADGTGVKPGKKELKREDYKKITIEEVKQNPIDESDNPAVHISPVSVMS